MEHNIFQRNVKVYIPFNPYYKKDIQLEITFLEQIEFYHRKLNRPYLISELIGDENLTRRHKKRIIKDILKYWGKDFKQYLDARKKEAMQNINHLKKFKFKDIELTSVSFLSVVIGVSLFMTRIFPKYNNYYIILVYLSLIALLYNLFLYNYFNEVQTTKTSIKRYINEEFKKINRSLKQQRKMIKRHLYKAIKKVRKTFLINKISDMDKMIDKVIHYTEIVEGKVIEFRRKYLFLIFFQYLSIISIFGFIIYIIYIMVIK